MDPFCICCSKKSFLSVYPHLLINILLFYGSTSVLGWHDHNYNKNNASVLLNEINQKAKLNIYVDDFLSSVTNILTTTVFKSYLETSVMSSKSWLYRWLHKGCQEKHHATRELLGTRSTHRNDQICGIKLALSMFAHM